MSDYSDYIVYVDESGDHSMTSVDSDYPVFVLAFCIFNKHSYSVNAVPKLKELKFRHFGHDMIILHENEIRRDKGVFSKLRTKEKKQAFIEELTDIIDQEFFTIIASVIKKDDLKSTYQRYDNPYHLALTYCLERTYRYLSELGEADKMTHVVVEQRGLREDNELELEFRRVCSGSNYLAKALPFQIILANKQSNSAGLQLADLVARPIGLSVIKPERKRGQATFSSLISI